MKEAIANAGVFNFVIIFVTLLLAFFIGSLGYSKAFKVKNLIISEIEKEENYEEAFESIEASLGEIGYRMNTNGSRVNCPRSDGATLVNHGGNYQYCIYRVDSCPGGADLHNEGTSRRCSHYYRVVTYMYFDIPIINHLLRIPVRGETKSFGVLNS